MIEFDDDVEQIVSNMANVDVSQYFFSETDITLNIFNGQMDLPKPKGIGDVAKKSVLMDSCIDEEDLE